MISYESLEITPHLKDLLQKRIKLSINGKIIRQGVLVLFTFKNYCVEMYFKSKQDEKIRKTDIPIPFEVVNKIAASDNSHVIFDYTIATFAKNNKMIADNIHSLHDNTQNKFYNNRLRIEVDDG